VRARSNAPKARNCRVNGTTRTCATNLRRRQTATFVTVTKVRKLGHHEERGVPKGNRTYVDAKTSRKSTHFGLSLAGKH
jgi:hypothetical protein